ncbi:MAG TPA: succinylglutamate desuccinylase/aspartoacylase family protein [Aliidongia sp.]|uniref:succinylglutamate desuccinylase/aspartoacylase family protein n=1 Tax=Aliidongia sp. TaxID=1914230 RepID=UPI002DDD9D3A|nr:succinylglutamate desuccinylase/aspartoacylase family protein [Aliidongia sp.]HEV2675650.1 succinylglutamate desuccinylase/aspartoacylase family protein [Aliidongia sp.]
MSQKSMISCSISLEDEGVRFGHLRVPHSVHRSAYGHIPIPIAVAKNGDGPTLLLTGGVHGDEYEGPIVLTKLMQKLEKLPVSGRVIILPSVNHPAYLAGTRTSPIDGLNLNRTFPGNRNGSVTQIIAHFVASELLPLADYAIDMHSGGSSLQYLPTLLAPRWDDPEDMQIIDGLIAAFAPTRVAFFDSRRSPDGEDRVFGNAAYHNKCHFLTGEFGGGSSVNPKGVGELQDGIAGLMRHIGVLRDDEPSAPAYIRFLSMNDDGLFAFAPQAGVFEPVFSLGDELPEGALAGRIYDPVNPWLPPVEVHFKSAGLAICVRTFALVEAGDCLGHLASDLVNRDGPVRASGLKRC